MYAAPGTSGVGSAVLAHLESEAAKLGYSEVWLETRAVNSRAVALYEQRGRPQIRSATPQPLLSSPKYRRQMACRRMIE